MNCPRCGHKARKNGKRPIRRRNYVGKRQSWICPTCWYQWEVK